MLILSFTVGSSSNKFLKPISAPRNHLCLPLLFSLWRLEVPVNLQIKNKISEFSLKTKEHTQTNIDSVEIRTHRDFLRRQWSNPSHASPSTPHNLPTASWVSVAPRWPRHLSPWLFSGNCVKLRVNIHMVIYSLSQAHEKTVKILSYLSLFPKS